MHPVKGIRGTFTVLGCFYSKLYKCFNSLKMQCIEHHNTEKLSVSYYILSYPLSRHYGDRPVPGNSLDFFAMGQQSHLSITPPVTRSTCPSFHLSHHLTCPIT